MGVGPAKPKFEPKFFGEIWIEPAEPNFCGNWVGTGSTQFFTKLELSRLNPEKSNNNGIWKPRI